MQIKDIIAKFGEEERKEVEKTIDACMGSINCKEVKWREFFVYESSSEMLEQTLKNLVIEFLLPIAEIARDEPDREVTIFCNYTGKKYDEIWTVRVNPLQLYATISLSKKTVKYLAKMKKTTEKDT